MRSSNIETTSAQVVAANDEDGSGPSTAATTAASAQLEGPLISITVEPSQDEHTTNASDVDASGKDVDHTDERTGVMTSRVADADNSALLGDDKVPHHYGVPSNNEGWLPMPLAWTLASPIVDEYGVPTTKGGHGVSEDGSSTVDGTTLKAINEQEVYNDENTIESTGFISDVLSMLIKQIVDNNPNISYLTLNNRTELTRVNFLQDLTTQAHQSTSNPTASETTVIREDDRRTPSPDSTLLAGEIIASLLTSSTSFPASSNVSRLESVTSERLEQTSPSDRTKATSTSDQSSNVASTTVRPRPDVVTRNSGNSAAVAD